MSTDCFPLHGENMSGVFKLMRGIFIGGQTIINKHADHTLLIVYNEQDEQHDDFGDSMVMTFIIKCSGLNKGYK